jgi:hypothetical protein
MKTEITHKNHVTTSLMGCKEDVVGTELVEMLHSMG